MPGGLLTICRFVILLKRRGFVDAIDSSQFGRDLVPCEDERLYSDASAHVLSPSLPLSKLFGLLFRRFENLSLARVGWKLSSGGLLGRGSEWRTFPLYLPAQTSIIWLSLPVPLFLSPHMLWDYSYTQHSCIQNEKNNLFFVWQTALKMGWNTNRHFEAFWDLVVNFLFLLKRIFRRVM